MQGVSVFAQLQDGAASLFALSVFLVVFLLYFYVPYWGVRQVPGPPRAVPLLGHLPLLGKYGPEVFSVLAKRYGPVFRFHMGRQPIVIVADPELCKEVGLKKFKNIPNRSMPSPIRGSPLHQKGLFFTRDARWSAMRNTIVSLYQPSQLVGLIPEMQACIESATDRLSALQEDINFSDFSLKLATDIIGQTAFGIDFGLSREVRDHCQLNEASAFIEDHVRSTTSLKMNLSGSLSVILGFLVPALQGPFKQVLKRIPGTADRKTESSNRKLTERLERIVAKRASEDCGELKDFLSTILSMRKSDMTSFELFSPDYVSALTYEHLLAGSTTTSFTLSSVVYLVSKHPEVERKLLREIDQYGTDCRVPTAEDLQSRFPYLDQVIKESMRFYTVSPLVARETSQPVEIGGYLLPKGAWVWLAIGVLAKDPNHFPDPHLFRPERFDPSCDEDKQRHPYAHIPFGIGPRSCIGQRFSLQEIKLTVIHLYRKYVFRHSPCMESPLQLEYGIVQNFKHGVKLRVISRFKT